MAGRYGIILLTTLISTGLFNTAFAGWTPAERISDECTAYSPRIVAQGDTLHAAYWASSFFTSSYYIFN